MSFYLILIIVNVHTVLLYAKSYTKHRTWILLTTTPYFIDKERERTRALKKQCSFCYEWKMMSFERGGNFGATPREKLEFALGGREREVRMEGMILKQWNDRLVGFCCCCSR